MLLAALVSVMSCSCPRPPVAVRPKTPPTDTTAPWEIGPVAERVAFLPTVKGVVPAPRASAPRLLKIRSLANCPARFLTLFAPLRVTSLPAVLALIARVSTEIPPPFRVAIPAGARICSFVIPGWKTADPPTVIRPLSLLPRLTCPPIKLATSMLSRVISAPELVPSAKVFPAVRFCTVMVGELIGASRATPSNLRKMELSAFTAPLTVRLLVLSTVKFLSAFVWPMPDRIVTAPPAGVMVRDCPPGVLPSRPPTDIGALASVALSAVSAARLSGPLIQMPPGPVAVRLAKPRAMPSREFNFRSARLRADLAVPV